MHVCVHTLCACGGVGGVEGGGGGGGGLVMEGRLDRECEWEWGIPSVKKDVTCIPLTQMSDCIDPRDDAWV